MIANKVRYPFKREVVLNALKIYLSNIAQGSQGPSLVFNKRKKLEIKAVFNADEDDTAVPKKRKLVPLGIILVLDFVTVLFILFHFTCSRLW